MTILDTHGNEYYLGGIEGKFDILTEQYLIPEGGTANLAWALSKIETVQGEKLYFDYTSYDLNNIGNWRSRLSTSIVAIEQMQIAEEPLNPSIHLDNDPNRGNASYSEAQPELEHRTNRSFFLTEIRGENETVIFQYASGLAFRNNPRLERIVIKGAQNEQIKQVDLLYDESTEYSSHRLLKQLKISQTGYGSEFEVYDFQYHDADSSNPLSISQDQWGYYANRIYRDDKSPYYIVLHEEMSDLSVHNDINNRYAFSSLKNILRDKSIWQNKRINNGGHKAFSLARIVNPSGGIWEYDYESHKYKNEYTNEIIQGGGQRLKETRMKAGYDTDNFLITKYQYGNLSTEPNNFDGIGKANFSDLNWTDFVSENMHYSENDFTVNDGINISAVKCVSPTRTYHSKPVLPEMNNFQVAYEKIKKTRYSSKNEDGEEGGTTYYYSIPQQYSFAYLPNYKYPPIVQNAGNYQVRKITSYTPNVSPILTKKIIEDLSGNYRREEIYSYNIQFNRSSYVSVNSSLAYTRTHYHQSQRNKPEDYNLQHCSSYEYIINTEGNPSLSRKTISEIETKNKKGPLITEDYTYNEDYQIESISYNSAVDPDDLKYQKTVKYFYPRDRANSRPNSLYSEMVDKNYISPIISEYTEYPSDKTKLIRTEYYKDSNLTHNRFLPKEELESDNNGDNLRVKITYDQYDTKGNILQYTGKDGISVSYIWSYNQQYPIAEVRNATYSMLETALSPDRINRLSTSFVPSESDIKALNNLRLNTTSLKNAHITTYTYQPLVGITSMTDPTGKTIYYQYDSFGRLSRTYLVEDGKEKDLEEYSYKYKNK